MTILAPDLDADIALDELEVDRDALARDNMPLAIFIATEKAKTAGHVKLDDLIAAGYVGLVKAARNWDPAKGVPFGSFASQVINWSIFDEMRAADPLGRIARDAVQAVKDAEELLRHQLMRDPSVEEIAEVTGMDVEAVDEAIRMDRAVRESGYLDDLDEDQAIDLTGDVILPEQAAEDRERRELLAAALAALPERMRTIVTEVYFHERGVKEVAAEMGVSHAYVSKQRAQALLLMRDAIDAWNGEPDQGRDTATRQAFFRRIAEDGGTRIARAFHIDQAA